MDCSPVPCPPLIKREMDCSPEVPNALSSIFIKTEMDCSPIPSPVPLSPTISIKNEILDCASSVPYTFIKTEVDYSPVPSPVPSLPPPTSEMDSSSVPPLKRRHDESTPEMDCSPLVPSSKRRRKCVSEMNCSPSVPPLPLSFPKLYQCAHCPKFGYIKKTELRAHIKLFTCNLCHWPSHHHFNHKYHNMSKIRQPKHIGRCYICKNLEFNEVSCLHSHYFHHHTREQFFQLQTEHCREILRNVKTEDEKIWKCEFCMTLYSNEKRLMNHIASFHYYICKFACGLCEFVTHSKSILTYHIQMKHQGENTDNYKKIDLISKLLDFKNVKIVDNKCSAAKVPKQYRVPNLLVNHKVSNKNDQVSEMKLLDVKNVKTVENICPAEVRKPYRPNLLKKTHQVSNDQVPEVQKSPKKVRVPKRERKISQEERNAQHDYVKKIIKYFREKHHKENHPQMKLQHKDELFCYVGNLKNYFKRCASNFSMLKHFEKCHLDTMICEICTENVLAVALTGRGNFNTYIKIMEITLYESQQDCESNNVLDTKEGGDNLKTGDTFGDTKNLSDGITIVVNPKNSETNLQAEPGNFESTSSSYVTKPKVEIYNPEYLNNPTDDQNLNTHQNLLSSDNNTGNFEFINFAETKIKSENIILSEDSYVCDYCGMVKTCKPELSHHITASHLLNQYQCRFCLATCDHRIQILYHIFTEHGLIPSRNPALRDHDYSVDYMTTVKIRNVIPQHMQNMDPFQSNEETDKKETDSTSIKKCNKKFVYLTKVDKDFDHSSEMDRKPVIYKNSGGKKYAMWYVNT